MLTPKDILQKAERKYPAFLRTLACNEPFFPINIPFRKVKASDDYMAVKTALKTLLSGSKKRKGYGYIVELQKRNTRKYGLQAYPARIFFATEKDYIKFLGKTDEVSEYKCNIAMLAKALPELKTWLIENPKTVVRYSAQWLDLLQVCQYFQDNPRPACYIRELPLTVHTKFIEEHQGILKQLLNILLPDSMIRENEKDFTRRFYLRTKEPLVRVRILDKQLQQQYNMPVTDFSSPVSQFTALNWRNHKVIITENEINFLTLPPQKNCLGIWGGGFRVGMLKEAIWLADCDLLYWGDIDAQGFQILSQLRSYFPKLCSLMMDLSTLTTFKDFIVAGTPTNVDNLVHLSTDEHDLFNHIKKHKIRLEQERITHTFAIQQLQY